MERSGETTTVKQDLMVHLQMAVEIELSTIPIPTVLGVVTIADIVLDGSPRQAQKTDLRPVQKTAHHQKWKYFTHFFHL